MLNINKPIIMTNVPVIIILQVTFYSRSLPIIGPPIAMVKTMGSNIKLALVMLKDKAAITKTGINIVEA